jgi:hypothetical protein
MKPNAFMGGGAEFWSGGSVVLYASSLHEVLIENIRGEPGVACTVAVLPGATVH